VLQVVFGGTQLHDRDRSPCATVRPGQGARERRFHCHVQVSCGPLGRPHPTTFCRDCVSSTGTALIDGHLLRLAPGDTSITAEKFLNQYLFAAVPALKELGGTAILAVEDNYVEPEDLLTLSAKSDIALIPPISGG
jgi:molybdopterin converting factor small subunit